MFGIGIELWLLLLLIVVPFFKAVPDLVDRTFQDGTTKIVWTLIVLFMPLFGPLLYLTIDRSQGQRLLK